MNGKRNIQRQTTIQFFTNYRMTQDISSYPIAVAYNTVSIVYAL